MIRPSFLVCSSACFAGPAAPQDRGDNANRQKNERQKFANLHLDRKQVSAQ